MRFQDRHEAGRRLAAELRRYQSKDTLVLALPRGGVVVGYEVARALDAPLDVLIVRKLGAPSQPELGIGAVAEGGVQLVDHALCRALDIDAGTVEEIAVRERREVERRMRRYRRGRQLPDLSDRTVILVDDGVATGGTARAAILALRALGPERIVFAVPVAGLEAAALLADEADELVALTVPEDMMAIGAWYDDFESVSDDEVLAWLERATQRERIGREVSIPAAEVTLEGNLVVPPHATGLVLFAHGSGSGRASPRNRMVAGALRAAGLATLLLDLLSSDEEELDARTGRLRFDIDLLAARVARATDWLRRRPSTAPLRIGYFGSSTGAGAALLAAAALPDSVGAVVSRGGRPDLATHALAAVRAPTLLIVGSEDAEVLRLNRQALRELRCEKQLEIVRGASHLFEEPGTLERVAELAAAWFSRHLVAHEDAARP